MSDVNFNRGYSSNIFDTSKVPFSEGTISISEDTRQLLIDAHNGKRIVISDVIDISDENASYTNIEGKIYIKGNKLQKYDPTLNKLVDVSSINNSVINASESFTLNSDLKTGSIAGIYGKEKDFIIDSKGNTGVIIGYNDKTTFVQIISMYGSENSKEVQYIYVGTKEGSKELGTISDPYTTFESLKENCEDIIENETIHKVITCVNDNFNFSYDAISNDSRNIAYNNCLIDCKGFIAYIYLGNCKNVKIIQSGACTLYNCESVEIVGGSVKSTYGINCIYRQQTGTIHLEGLGKYLIDDSNIKYGANIIKDYNPIGSGSITIYGNNDDLQILDCSNIDSLVIIRSSRPDKNDPGANVLLRNVRCESIVVDEYIDNLILESGSCLNENLTSIINAVNVDLGTFEFKNDPYYRKEVDSSHPLTEDIPYPNIKDRVGLSSKQVYDTKDRTYVDKYISDSEDLTSDDKQKNLEFHLDAIDHSINKLNTQVDALSDEGSGLAEAYISKGVFKVSEDLSSSKWRTGDVLKFVAKTPITISKKHSVEAIKMELVTEMVEEITQDDEGKDITNTVEKKYYDIYFNSNNTLSYVAQYNDSFTIYKNLTGETDNETTDILEGTINYVDKSILICRIEQNESNIGILIPFAESDVETAKQYTGEFNHTFSVNTNDRLIRLDNDWDKLVSSADSASGNYRIVDKRSDLNFIMTDDTRPIGLLGYVVNDEMMYQWRNKDGKLQWVVFSSGTGGGSNAVKLQILDKSPTYGLSITDSLYLNVDVYNCTTGVLTVSYTVKGKSPRKKTFNINEPTTINVILDDFGSDIGLGVLSTSVVTSVSFVSSDPDIANPDAIYNTFYLGSSTSATFKQLNGFSSSGKYILKDSAITNEYDVDSYLIDDDFDINKCSLTFEAVSISNENYKVKCLIYKNDELLNTITSENITGVTQVSISLPTLKSDEATPIVYDSGIYYIKYYTETTNSKSSENIYKFILEDSIAPKIFILNELETQSINEDVTQVNMNLYYVSIFNDSNYDLTIHPSLTNRELQEIYTGNESLTIRDKKYRETAINITDPSILESIRTNDSFQLLSVSIKYNELISNYKTMIFNVPDSILIVKDQMVFNLSSLGKSNYSIDKYDWNSSIVKNSNLKVNLSGFDFSTNGWIEKTTDDSGIVSVLSGNGYDNSVSINLSPLYKYNESIFEGSTGRYDVNSGYTVQIKFKAIKTNDNGTILECIDDTGKGFLITENKVIFSPYEPLSTTFYNNVNILGSGLTTDEWHEITFVVTVDGDNTNPSPYEQFMYNNNMYEASGQVACKSCAFLYIDGVLSGMARGNANDGSSEDNPAAWYSTSQVNERISTLFARYDHKQKLYYDYGKGEIMHYRQYNKALTPEEVLINYIADMHDAVSQSNSKTKNGLAKTETEYVFGQNSDNALPTLHFYNADLSRLDSIMGVTAKDYEFPNVTVTLTYHDKVIFQHFGCELKVQGTSSCNYAIKNYRLRFYDYKPTEEELAVRGFTPESSQIELSNFALPDSIVFETKEGTNAIDSNAYNTLWFSNNVDRRSYKGDAADLHGKGKKLKESVNGWLPESRYTLKADYMDSSHTHNTGTARLANEYMPSIPPQKESTDTIVNPYDITNEEKFESVSMKIEDIKETTTDEQLKSKTKVNPRTKIRQAIDGFPILVTYSYPSNKNDKDGSSPVSTIQKGIYMFNLDKSANYNFGYEEYKNKCKSYEISNNNATGTISAAGFNIDVLNIEESYTSESENPLMAVKNEIEARYHYNEELNEDTMNDVVELLEKSFGKEYIIDDSDYEKGIKIGGGLSLNNLVDVLKDNGYIRVIGEYRSGSELYRMPGNYDYLGRDNSQYIYETTIAITDLYLDDPAAEDPMITSCTLKFNAIALNPYDETLTLGVKNSGYQYESSDTDVHQHDELKHLLMWFKYCADSKSPDEFRKNYSKHLDLTNMEQYILLVQCLGMVDNLAKNMMITTWDADKEYIVYKVSNDGNVEVDWERSTFCKWYFQFYDLDTSFGLTNDGHLNYDVSMRIAGRENKDGNLPASEILSLPSGVDESKITDIVKESFNAYDSNLWNQLFNAFGSINYGKSGIANGLQETYANVRQRDNNALTVETFTNYVINSISNVIGEYYFNLDAINKYFGWNFIPPSTVTTDKPFDAKEYFYMCLGSAKNQMITWLNGRLAYMDTYFSYNSDQTKIRPNANILEASSFVKPLSPVYFYVSAADDEAITPQLLTGQSENLFKYKITQDANMVWYNVSQLTSLSGINQLNVKELDLSSATNLVDIDLGNSTNINKLSLSSKYLKKLNLTHMNSLKSVDISSLKSLVDLDISDSGISELTTGDVSLRKLNITNSGLSNLNLSGLTNLESLGKINISTNTNWNDYNKFIACLEGYYLIPTLPAEDNESYESIKLERDNYLKNILTQFKNTLSSTNLLTSFENDVTNNKYTTAEQQLQYLFSSSTYRSAIGQQYIPGLFMLDSNKEFNSIKINSDKIKAVYLRCSNANKYIGKEDGTISISGKNIKYIYMYHGDLSFENESDATELKGVLSINCESLEKLTINDFKYNKDLDLSTCDNIKYLDLHNCNSMTGVILSEKCRANGTISDINLNENWKFSHLCTRNELKESNELIDLTNFKLNKLLMNRVIYFTKIKGMNLQLSSSSNFDMSVRYNTYGATTTDPALMTQLNAFYNDGEKIATFENSSITINASKFDFSYKFDGRCNMRFNFGQSNGLKLININNIQSLIATFGNCWELTLDDVFYILGVTKSSGFGSNNNFALTQVSSTAQRPTSCINFIETFKFCVGINFPIYTSVNNKRRYVPDDLFINCVKAISLRCMFGGFDRKAINGSLYKVNYSDGNKESKLSSLILPSKLYSYLGSDANIEGMFSYTALGVAASLLQNLQISTPIINNSYTESRNLFYKYYSYIYAIHDDTYSTLSNPAIFNCMYNILNGEVPYSDVSNRATTVGTTVNEFFIIKVNSTDETDVLYTVLKSFKSIDYDNMFMYTRPIKYATTLANAVNNSGEFITVGPNIFKTATGDKRNVTSLSHTFAYFNKNMKLDYLYEPEEGITQYPELSTRFKLFDNLYTSSVIDLQYCFYDNIQMTKFDPLMFMSFYNPTNPDMPNLNLTQPTSILYVKNARYMFGECANLKGLFSKCTTIVDDSGATQYHEPYIRWKQLSVFSYQINLTSAEGMFYNCKLLGGYIERQIDDAGNEMYMESMDIPTNIFADLNKCSSLARLFTNCSNMTFDFSNLDSSENQDDWIYLFENCYRLTNIQSMFDGCTKLKNNLPTYGSKGESDSHSAYFYYDIKNSIRNWINSLTNPTLIKKYIDDGYFTYPDGYEPYLKDENGIPILDDYNNMQYAEDEPEKRIYAFDDIINDTNDWKSIFKMCYVLYNVDANGKNTDEVTNIYQYYKAYEDSVINGDIIQHFTDKTLGELYGSIYEAPIYETDDLHEINIHKKYIRTDGFFYISNNEVNNDKLNPLKCINNVFTGCVNLNKGIPSNLFKDMAYVEYASGVFSGCTSIGLGSGGYNSESDFSVTESSANQSQVKTPPYFMPYGLLDDMTNVINISNMFSGVRYLSKPFLTKLYYPNLMTDNYAANGKARDEIYCIPKYFLYFNTKLTNVANLFGGANKNYMFGIIYEGMFENKSYTAINPSNITNISGLFKNTCIIGCKEHPDYSNDFLTNPAQDKMYYVGERLLYPLTQLLDASSLFESCASPMFALTYVEKNQMRTRDLLFRSDRHQLRSLKTKNLISFNTLWQAYNKLITAPAFGKLVHKTDAVDINGDYQCFEFYTDATTAGDSLQEIKFS